MRTLLVSDFYPPVAGGKEFHVDALAAELARQGNEVAVATLTRDAMPSHPGIRIFPVSGLANVLPHQDRARPFHPPVPDPASRRALLRAIERFRPDVVHGHSWLTASLPGKLSAPVVFTAHDYALICQLQTLMHPDADVCEGPELAKCVSCGAHTYGRVRSELLARGTIAGRRRFPAQRILAVSQTVADALKPHVHVRVDVVSNFVAPAAQPEPLPAGLPEQFVLYAGDGRPYKGVPELLTVWSTSAPQLPLVLASPRAPSGPLPANVFVVSLSRGQMVEAWRRAALAVVPSRWADPCPTVVLEAMRAGVPVVGARRGGIQELIRDGIDGLLVPPRDAPALGTAVESLLQDDARRAGFSRNATARAADFSVEVVTTQIQAVYRQLD